jgi:hypothetical protein
VQTEDEILAGGGGRRFGCGRAGGATGVLEGVGDLRVPEAQRELDRLSPSLVACAASAPLRRSSSIIGRLPRIAAYASGV